MTNAFDPGLTWECLDEQLAHTRQSCYHLNRIIKTGGGNKVKISINRDAYKAQSYATVSVLSADLKWTTLITEPGATWFDDTHWNAVTPAEILATLGDFADELLSRALLCLC
jgi:hypothetical protein